MCIRDRGSTISQQIIKNLYGRERHGLLTVPVNKIKEALVAQRLERVYDKRGVLVLYLNSVPFGENLYGIESAARRFFGRSTARLGVEEAAVLVGMLKANTAYNPRLHPDRARERRNTVLSLMEKHGHLDARAADSLQALPLRLRYTGLDAYDVYGYFVARVAEEAEALLREQAAPKPARDRKKRKQAAPPPAVIPDLRKDGRSDRDRERIRGEIRDLDRRRQSARSDVYRRERDLDYVRQRYRI